MDFSLVSQTNLNFPFKTIISAVFIFSLLSNCASQKTQTKQAVVDDKSKAVQASIEHISAQEHLQQVALTDSPDEALLSLTHAAHEFLVEKKYGQALWIANKLTKLFLIENKVFTENLAENKNELETAGTKGKNTFNKPHNQSLNYRLVLIKAASLLSLSQTKLAYQALLQADEVSRGHQIKHSDKYYNLLGDVQKLRQLELASVNAKLIAFSLNPDANNSDSEFLWSSISKLSQWQLGQLKRLNPPHIKGWLQLASYANKFGHDANQFSRYLNQWQRKFVTHPANSVISSLRTQSLYDENTIETKENNNIAVLIPLTGKQKVAGTVIQQGILAAYENDDKTLHFFDSNNLDMTTLVDTFAQAEIDYVIGPLLKPAVKAYVAQTDLTIPTLLLNLPETGTFGLMEHQVALSMRREDEAVQAATTLSQKQYDHPLILSHQDNTSKRIATTFARQWQRLTGISPEIVYVSKGKETQEKLKQGLDVLLSQARINDLNIRIKQSIKTETRNRRDIDMIYLVGSAKQTRLLKPYIDVNISPFAALIPVYASSLSHGSKIEKSVTRDLSGLVFTEIPWSLQSKQQNKSLAKLSKQLWPNRSDSLQRFFAMGFDSYSLIEKIPQMKAKPYVRHFGQTGVLQLNANNILTRSLLWGRYQKDRVREIAME